MSRSHTMTPWTAAASLSLDAPGVKPPAASLPWPGARLQSHSPLWARCRPTLAFFDSFKYICKSLPRVLANDRQPFPPRLGVMTSFPQFQNPASFRYVPFFRKARPITHIVLIERDVPQNVRGIGFVCFPLSVHRPPAGASHARAQAAFIVRHISVSLHLASRGANLRDHGCWRAVF